MPRYYLCMSGLFLYLYNELATLAMSRTSALTASVANTAKRAFVIVGVGVAMGKVRPLMCRRRRRYLDPRMSRWPYARVL